MPQNWVDMNGVKMNAEIYGYLVKNNLFIMLRAKEDEEPETNTSGGATLSKKNVDLYPWICLLPTHCICRTMTGCTCRQVSMPWRVLHLFAWDFFKGASNPRKRGEVVHHKNGDKMDARIKNLGKGTRRAHGLAHKARRQKFSTRKKFNLGSMFRPHQPAQVISRPDLIGKIEKIPVKTPSVSKATQIGGMEDRLGVLYPDLASKMSHLDSGTAIPRSAPAAAWRTPKSRMLGLKEPRLDTMAGEAAFVLLLVRSRFDMAAVVAATGESEELLRSLFDRPAVSLAIQRWRSYRRLPLVSS